MNDDEDDEIVQAFLIESQEGLDQLDRDLIELERDPSATERLSAVFRTVHTIKGTSGFLAFGRLEQVTHVGENLLSRLRDGQMQMTPVTADALLLMVDTVRALLASIATTGGDADSQVDTDSTVQRLVEALEGGPAETPAAAKAPSAVDPREPVAETSEQAAETQEARAEASQPVVEASAPTPTSVAPVPPAKVSSSSESPANTGESSVRVDVDLLDTLVRLVGELVLTRNQILQQAEVGDEPDLIRASQRLDIVASELQESIMRTRMQPIGQAWTKFPRVVRDLGAQLGKHVDLQMSGQETELDRSLLEAVKDPLTHLVRNAIDHGIETAEKRIAAGKPSTGSLALRSYHESGQVIVEIADDGAGIDARRVGDIAVERGVITDEQRVRMSDADLRDLIFRPGFSTAAAVTNVSGRGVGMDVVRTNIERIGGVVDVVSTAGAGTTVRVRIPLTLAIIPALVVGEGGERYAIPQANLVELVRLEAADVARDVTEVRGAPLMRLRGQLLPLVSLSSALGGTEPLDRPVLTVVVVQADGVRFGLTVQEIHDTQEIVVKPVGRQLKGVPLYAGATIMGDGRIALILDIGGMARTAGVTDVHCNEVATNSNETSTSLLVLDVGHGRRAAMPLERVSRLEEIDPARIEKSGDVEVVQYRDVLLPLVRLAQRIGVPAGPPGESMSVVVHEHDGRWVGIVAERVVDVVDTATTISPVGRRRGILGTVVVQDRVTDLVDIAEIVAAAGVGA